MEFPYPNPIILLEGANFTWMGLSCGSKKSCLGQRSGTKQQLNIAAKGLLFSDSAVMFSIINSGRAVAT
jgi:hypothetical protein